ncbi:thiamine phosphate synthase [Nocardioides pakistanensis]
MTGVDLPRLLLLTDRHQVPPGRDLVGTVADCASAGLEAVVLRELDLPEQQRQEIARALGSAGVTVILARTWLPGAAAVHLAAAQSRHDADAAPFHGRSCHDDEEVRRAVAGGASYLTISPVAASASKPGYGPAVGEGGVRRAVALAGDVPVFALGGVEVENAAAMRAAGAHGVAVMGAVMRAPDPTGVVARVLEEVR